MELVEKYSPDLVYMDNYGLPLERYGLAAAAHYYNRSIATNGKVDVVLTGKKLDSKQRLALTDDVERGFVDGIREQPWQTCTCIGNWHYDRELYERKGYKSAKQVVQRLMDVVSKNGNLLLSIPQRGDGSIDDEEEKILADMARWMKINREAVFASRPWRRFGEGPTKAAEGMQSEGKAAAFTAADIRFTTRKGKLYAAMLDWPDGTSAIASLGKTALPQAKIGKVFLLGHGALKFRQDAAGLYFNLPPAKSGAFVPIIRIEGAGLA